LASKQAVSEAGLRAHEIVAERELLTIGSQIRRASVSIPCNLAEGSTRRSKKEFAHFVSIARGSCAELQTLIELCVEFGIVADDAELSGEIDEVARMLFGLERSVRDVRASKVQTSEPEN